MKNVLVTGGTVFVSRYVAEYYVNKGYRVFVLNRNNRKQVEGAILIEADRRCIGEKLSGLHFDLIADITAYTGEDVERLTDAVGSYEDYILISSSAVYPQDTPQPFSENARTGRNKFWGKYGTDKLAAEEMLRTKVPNAYILRPPYLYGPYNNVYREAFVFDCAMSDRKFYLPKDGAMKLQFFYIDDLCRFMDVLIEQRPTERIFNVGNEVAISIRDWVALCYRIAGKEAEFISVDEAIEQRSYFSFYDYEYQLDVHAQKELLPETTSLEAGLAAAFEWYGKNSEQVVKKPYLEFIDSHFRP